MGGLRFPVVPTVMELLQACAPIGGAGRPESSGDQAYDIGRLCRTLGREHPDDAERLASEIEQQIECSRTTLALPVDEIRRCAASLRDGIRISHIDAYYRDRRGFTLATVRD